MHSCGFSGRESEFPCRMWLLVGQPHIWRMAPHPGYRDSTNFKKDIEVGGKDGFKGKIGANIIKMCCMKFSMN